MSARPPDVTGPPDERQARQMTDRRARGLAAGAGLTAEKIPDMLCLAVSRPAGQAPAPVPDDPGDAPAPKQPKQPEQPGQPGQQPVEDDAAEPVPASETDLRFMTGLAA